MQINYNKILNENMLNVLIDILKFIKKNGMPPGNQLYINFKTNNKKVIIPDWLKKKYPSEITIIIEYEYKNIQLSKEHFDVSLSFNDIYVDIRVPYASIISFADPNSKFGLKLQEDQNNTSKEKVTKVKIKDKENVIDFTKFKKN